MKEAIYIPTATGESFRKIKPRTITRKRNGLFAHVKGADVMIKKKDGIYVQVNSRDQKLPKFTFCLACGRLLTNEESVERHIGPVCAGHK